MNEPLTPKQVAQNQKAVDQMVALLELKKIKIGDVITEQQFDAIYLWLGRLLKSMPEPKTEETRNL